MEIPLLEPSNLEEFHSSSGLPPPPPPPILSLEEVPEAFRSPVRASSSWGSYSRRSERMSLDADDDDAHKESRCSQRSTDDDSLQFSLPLVIDTKSASAPTSPIEDEKQPASVGAGLSNLGNTCFLNSVLQCLTHTVELVQRLSLYADHLPCERNNDRFCMFCALRKHIELSITSTGRVISPYNFVNNLSYISSSFQRFQQEDAHEFLQCFLDRLDSSCDNLMRKETPLSLQDDNLVKIFGGRVVSKLRCCNCNHSSDTYEPSVDLSLEIDDADTLLSALDSFTKVEKIEDADTKFICESCKEEVLVEKQLMLEQAPVVSALHLKRFKNYGSYVEKIEKHVDFPLELDLEPYTRTNEDNVDLKYDLYAVVVHTAWTSTFGHYYCFIRAAPDTWFKFDDSMVTRVREAYVLSQEAYILFYTKQGTPWISSFMETFKPLLDPNLSNASPKSVLDSSMLCLNVPSDNSNNVNETSEVGYEFPAEPFRHYGNEFLKEDKADFDRMDTSLPSETIKSEVEKVLLPSVPSARKGNNFNRELGKVDNSIVTPKTPPRSYSPDIYKEEASPEVVFSSKRLQVKSVDRVSSKRQFKNDMNDPKIKEAFRQCKKMHSTRGAALFEAAMEGSQSEGSLTNKSTKRIASTPNRNYSQSSDRRKQNHNSFSHPVAAASLQ